uniref:Uncharacterized protein n=1 Tax=Acrobeloides nanus TaxID=290746 RepID=A0A914DV05_9BILA
MDQNAEEVVRSAHERVKRDYFSLDLDEFLSKDLERRRICTDRLCGCYNGETVEKQLKDTIKKYTLFFKSKFPHMGRGTIGKLFESASIRERWADIPTEERGVNRAVRAEDLKQFVNSYCTIFEKIFFDDANRKEKGPDGHERRCIACYKWLQLEFGTLRTDTIKKVIRGIKNHNILAAALLCFALQNKFTDHSGFKPVRKKIRVTNDTWVLFKKCLGKEHARDRARELRDFILDTSIAKSISEKYKEIISELRQGFPKFFLDDGSFDKLVFDQADYGELQDCDKCHGDYAAQFLTTCEKPDGTSEHKFCRNCMRELAMTIEQAFPEVDEKFKMKLECIKDGCNNEIRIDEVSFLYFPRYARTRLHSASLEGMLLQLGHVRT